VIVELSSIIAAILFPVFAKFRERLADVRVLSNESTRLRIYQYVRITTNIPTFGAALLHAGTGMGRPSSGMSQLTGLYHCPE